MGPSLGTTLVCSSARDLKLCRDSTSHAPGVTARDALEGKGPQRPPQKRLELQLEEVAKAVGGGYCRLQMPLKLGVRGTVAEHRLPAVVTAARMHAHQAATSLCLVLAQSQTVYGMGREAHTAAHMQHFAGRDAVTETDGPHVAGEPIWKSGGETRDGFSVGAGD